ncbi:MAG: 50S ribosomal protein L25, partial [Candidatus Omnitrophica bacterium]|nr:50S ribosomal protein L25 [Candidatus Omnitrophota bacterium]
MEKIFLEVEQRDELGKSQANNLRKQGFIPSVFYSQGKKTQTIKIAQGQLLRLIHQHRIENIVINLKIVSKALKSDKKDKVYPCLIKEVQYDPVKGDIIHVDFNEISLLKTVKVNVPVAAKGEPIGIKQEGGSLEHILWEIEVECLPADIPKEIEVDVSQLKIGDDIHIKDIVVAANIKVLNDPEAIVLSVAAPMKEEAVEASMEGEAGQEPEVIKEKKEVPAEEGEEKEEEKGKEK